MIELAVVRLREDARSRSGPTPATPGSTSPRASACELAPGERAVVPTGLAVAIPEGFAGFVQPRSGLAARHGIAVVNSPGLIDSGYRGEIRVVLLNTDREQHLRRRGGRPDRPARRPARSPSSSSSSWTSCRASERGVRGFGSSRT